MTQILEPGMHFQTRSHTIKEQNVWINDGHDPLFKCQNRSAAAAEGERERVILIGGIQDREILQFFNFSGTLSLLTHHSSTISNYLAKIILWKTLTTAKGEEQVKKRSSSTIRRSNVLLISMLCKLTMINRKLIIGDARNSETWYWKYPVWLTSSLWLVCIQLLLWSGALL